ncbi:hypothetical protein [Microbacterium kunmingense]|uniref:hypothetical protein n=1 Tax=Microbacterium kunmingense TaxID=2915939 RepID=UPI003D712ABB
MVVADEKDALVARILELEAANERLQSERGATPPPAGRRWRSIVSAALIVVAALLVPLSIVTAWARIQLIDEESFVTTLAPLADDPAVQSMIVDETMQAIQAQVDFRQLTAEVFDGLADLGLPPRAESALQLLEAPAANGLEGLASTAVTRLVESDVFSDVWATLTRATHRALATAATSDGGGLVVRTADGVGVQIGVLVERVKQNLIDQGVGVAQLIPSVDRVVILGDGQNLDTVRTAYALATILGWWLPVVTLLLFVAGILVARKRSTAILGTGIGLAVGATVLALTFAIGGSVVRGVAIEQDISPDGLHVLYQRLVGGMSQSAIVLGLLGLFIAFLGWVLGASRGATGMRRTVRRVNVSIRDGLAARGFDTGRAGRWLARQRVLVRVIIVVLALVWLLALRPLTVGAVVLVLLTASAVAWALELLQRRDPEAARGDLSRDGDQVTVGEPEYTLAASKADERQARGFE